MDKNNIDNLVIPADEIKMENTNSFQVLTIKPSNIEKFNWNNPNYLKLLIAQDFYNQEKIEPSNLMELIGKTLDVNKHKIQNVEVQLIAEEPEYIYEIMYLDFEKNKEKQTDELKNQMATLVNINGDEIYGNAIILKTHMSTETNSMKFDDMTLEDLHRVMYYRANNIIVTYNDETELWEETTVFGDLQLYADKFFGSDKSRIKRTELPFLRHNINIWYTTSDYSEPERCGKLLNANIDKCIIFTMMTDVYRGNLTLKEVNKIIKLSKVINTFKTPDKYLKEDELDELKRRVVYNKYKVLNLVYKKYFNN